MHVGFNPKNGCLPLFARISQSVANFKEKQFHLITWEQFPFHVRVGRSCLFQPKLIFQGFSTQPTASWETPHTHKHTHFCAVHDFFHRHRSMLCCAAATHVEIDFVQEIFPPCTAGEKQQWKTKSPSPPASNTLLMTTSPTHGLMLPFSYGSEASRGGLTVRTLWFLLFSLLLLLVAAQPLKAVPED